MQSANLFIYFLLALGAAAAALTKKLTPTAALTGAIVGLLIFKGAGYQGVCMLALFFVLGSWATGWQKQAKVHMNRVEKHEGGRNLGQVLANAGVAAILGGVAWSIPKYGPPLKLMIAGSLAAAMADTLSSELGTVYGRRFYNIVTLKKGVRGLDGVISLEGTLTGIIGALMVGLIYCFGLRRWSALPMIVVAGFIGNTIDSVLGATLERRGIIENNSVNFLNTLTGALVCLLFSQIA